MDYKNTIWNEIKIKQGFENFFKEFRRYPTAHEIDNCKDLPSSRQLQRRFGGLKKIREKLNLPNIDNTKGINFAIDVFYPADTYSLNSCINIKSKIYKNIDCEIILLCTNIAVNQPVIDRAINNRRNILTPNIRVLDLNNFILFIQKQTPLTLT